MTGDMNLVFGWGSPIGTGLFLFLLGNFIFMLSKAGKEKKQ